MNVARQGRDQAPAFRWKAAETITRFCDLAAAVVHAVGREGRFVDVISRRHEKRCQRAFRARRALGLPMETRGRRSMLHEG